MALNSIRLLGGRVVVIKNKPLFLPVCSARTIVSKALREKKEKPAPWPYKTKAFNYQHMFTDHTTLRMDENSKLIVVEGSHAIGKSEFAKQLADEFEMHYMPPFNMDEIFINYYGDDFRHYSHYFPDFFKTFDTKDFFRDPLGGAHSTTLERYLLRVYQLKWLNQLRACQHIMNTGQGVVMEGCANSDYIHFNACFDQGWIDPEMKRIYNSILKNTLHEVNRPNLIVYLDAPVDVVQRNVKTRGNEWDKDSPIWNNTQYLSYIYDEYKNNFLKDMQTYSRVLVYDWSDGGDTEVVVEDIENLEMDLIEKYSEQQGDWRWNHEGGAGYHRYLFTNRRHVFKKLNTFYVRDFGNKNILTATPEDVLAMRDVFRWIKSEVYKSGANPLMGDNSLWLKLFRYRPVPLDAYFHNMFFSMEESLTPYEISEAEKHGYWLEPKIPEGESAKKAQSN